MISEQIAYQIADRAVKAFSHDFQIMAQNTTKAETGWVFFYNSGEFLRTGDPVKALAGNGPVFVSHDGDLSHLPASIPWEEALQRRSSL